MKNIGKTILILIFVCLFSTQALDIGECAQLNSDGWSCAKCRANYHLFEGRCYIDILGCTDYYSGSICQQCSQGYMLYNNLCCDQICLSKILATDDDTPIISVNDPNITKPLTDILNKIQNGKLNGSMFVLSKIQLIKYQDATRYFLLYKIISSYQSDYYLKRSIVDYILATGDIVEIDWSLIAANTPLTQIANKTVHSDTFSVVLTKFPTIYKTIGALTQYAITTDVVTQMQQHVVINYNFASNQGNLLFLYSYQGKPIILINVTNPINSAFQPYSKIYKTIIEITAQIQSNNIYLKRALALWLQQTGNTQGNLKIVVESADSYGMITFKFYSQTDTQVVQTFINYVRQDDNVVVSVINRYPKPVAPTVNINLPTTVDIVSQTDGQIRTVFGNRTTVVIGNFLFNTLGQLDNFYFSNQAEKDMIKAYIKNSKPFQVISLTNCRYTDFTFIYNDVVSTGKFVFIYFMQNNANPSDIVYLGYLGSSSTVDPAIAYNVAFDGTTLVSVSGNALTQNQIKTVNVKTTPYLKKTTVSVLQNQMLTKYFLYSFIGVTRSNQNRTCVGRIINSTQQIWTNVLGLTGYTTFNPEALIPSDSTLTIIMTNIRTTLTSISAWKLIKVQSYNYNKGIEYVVVLSDQDFRAIVVVVYDITSKAVSIVNFEIVSLSQYTTFSSNRLELIKNDLLQVTPVPVTITTTQILLAKALPIISVTLTNVDSVIRAYDSPTTERDMIFVKNTDGTFTFYVFVTKFGVASPSPVLIHVGTVTAAIMSALTDIGASVGPSSITEKTASGSSQASGLFFDGQAYQIQQNIRQDLLDPKIKDLLNFVKQSQKLTVIPGNLTYIQQHTDAVVVQYAFSYLNTDKSFTRYFVVKPNSASFNRVYLGKENLNSSTNPKTNRFFKPIPSLNITGNQAKFQEYAVFTSSSINPAFKMNLQASNVIRLWQTNYPLGAYTIVYFKTPIYEAAAYIIKNQVPSALLFFTQTVNGSIFDVVPTVQLSSTDPVSVGIMNSYVKYYEQLINILPAQTQSTTPSSDTYTLMFDYAPQTIGLTSSSLNTFASCSFEVRWNNVVVASIVPVDPLKTTYSVQVVANTARLNLTFVGTGAADGIGATIDSVRLFPAGQQNNQSANILINSDFEDPKIPSGNVLRVTSVFGWQAVNSVAFNMFVGVGKAFNDVWSNQVAVLDSSNTNAEFFYTLNFNANGVFINVPLLCLSFEYSNLRAFQYNSAPSGGIALNAAPLAKFFPSANKIKFTVYFWALRTNQIRFLANQPIVLDNIQLTINGSNTNFIVNNDFQDFVVLSLNTIIDTMRGWTGKVILGNASQWSPTMSTQAVLLNPLVSSDFISILQTVLFSQTYQYVSNIRSASDICYILHFYAAALNGQPLNVSRGIVDWNNGGPAYVIKPYNYLTFASTVLLYPREGSNTLKFFGTADDGNGNGLTIDNVTLTVKNSKYNLNLQNGDFEYSFVGQNIVTDNTFFGWNGMNRIGLGKFFTPNWLPDNKQVSVLTTDTNYFRAFTYNSSNPFPPPGIESPSYTFSFDYAPKRKDTTETNWKTSKLLVLFNNQILAILTPTTTDVTKFTKNIQPRVANNSLTFTALSGEFFVDNVVMTLASGKNIIVNGGFEQPNIGQTEASASNVQGWITKFIIGYSGYYGSVNPWTTQSQVLVINPQNSPVSQFLIFDQNYNYNPSLQIGSKYQFSLYYAASANNTIDKSAATVKWNNEVIMNLSCASYNKIYFQTYTVTLLNGENTLFIQGLAGQGTGLNIDNVTLIAKSGANKQNLIINGDFEYPSLQDNVWLTSSKWKGWMRNFDIGPGPAFNPVWPKTQVANIDGKLANLYQVINYDLKNDVNIPNPLFMGDVYTLSFNYAGLPNISAATTRITVEWNNYIAGYVVPMASGWQAFVGDVIVNPGNNIITFRETGTNDTFGLLIDNIVLKKGPTGSNILYNGDFEYPNIGPDSKQSIFPYWNNIFTIVNATTKNPALPYTQAGYLIKNGLGTEISQGFFFDNNFKFIPPTTPSTVYDAWVLNFDYAPNVPSGQTVTDYSTYSATIMWNNVNILTFVPTSSSVANTFVIVPVTTGLNNFTIKGVGVADGLGLTVSNFKLYKGKNLQDNFFVNGNFKLPGSKYNGTNIPGWTGDVDVLEGGSVWSSNTFVANLDRTDTTGSRLTYIYQGFTFDQNYNVIPAPAALPVLTLSLNFAVSQGIDVTRATATVFWNGFVVMKLSSTNYNVNTNQVFVMPIRGSNTIRIVPDGNLTDKGLTIDNVKVSLATNPNTQFIYNGNFDAIYFYEKKVNSDKIPGWFGSLIEVAPGSLYNKNWPKTQVCNLADRYLSGTVLIDQNGTVIIPPQPPTMVISFYYAARQGKPLETSVGYVTWNSYLINQIKPTNYDVNFYTFEVIPAIGQNTIVFEGDDNLIDDYGVGIDNVSLTYKGLTQNLLQNPGFEMPDIGGYSVVGSLPYWIGKLEVGKGVLYNDKWTVGNKQIVQLDSNDTDRKVNFTQSIYFDYNFKYQPTPNANASESWLTIAQNYLKTLDPGFKTCSMNQYIETLFVRGAVELMDTTCTLKEVKLNCTFSVTVALQSPYTLNYYQCKNADPNSNYVPPGIPPADNPFNNQTDNGNSLINIANNKTVPIPLDPDVINEGKANKLIDDFEKGDTLKPVDITSSFISEIVIYLRATYGLIDGAPVIKASQDTSVTTPNVFRYVLYFFIRPQPGGKYRVVRAVVDYDNSGLELRIFVLAVDIFISSETVVLNVTTTAAQVAAKQPLDIDIAYGYEPLTINPALKATLADVLYQITTRHSKLVSGKDLAAAEQLPLRNGKINYKLTFLDPTTSQKVKFIVFYDPTINSVLLLNPLSLPNTDQFTQMSDAEKSADTILANAIGFVKGLHPLEYSSKAILECVTKGVLSTYTQYRIMWRNNEIQYRSFIRITAQGAKQQVLFGEVETIALDRYRLDQFQQLYITKFQKMNDTQITSDTNFLNAYRYLIMSNLKLGQSNLIGATMKPLSTGYLYQISFKLPNSTIVRIEVYVELYSLTVTVRNMYTDDFTSNFNLLSVNDKNIDAIARFIRSTATNPTTSEAEAVTKVQTKSFLFGNLFRVSIRGTTTRTALVYYNEFSQTLQLVNWAQENTLAGCQTKDRNGLCTLCSEGQSVVNGYCVFGCGDLCKNIPL